MISCLEEKVFLSLIVACYGRSIDKTKPDNKWRDGSDLAKNRGGLGRVKTRPKSTSFFALCYYYRPVFLYPSVLLTEHLEKAILRESGTILSS